MDGNNTATVSGKGKFKVHWEIWSILIIFGIVIVIANMLICVIFIVWKQLRTPTNTFLVMLAVADLMVGVLFIPLYIGGHYIEYHTSVNITENLDIILLFTFFTSVFNLYAVTLDRYIAVIHALRYNALMTARNIRYIVLTAWICPICITSILIISKFTSEYALMYVLFGMEIVFVIIPGFLMVVVYVKIFKEARRQITQVASLQVSGDNNRFAKENKRKSEHRVAKVKQSSFSPCS